MLSQIISGTEFAFERDGGVGCYETMLKESFAPYSDKLRKAVETRRNGLTRQTLEIGQQAPDFTLYNTANEQVSLHDLTKKSHVILLFFPLAFSDVCSQELCSVRDNMNKYTQLNATVVGISIDSMFALNKFKQEKNYQFDLLSDFNKTVARQYNVLYEEFPIFQMKGVTKRAAFVIDRHGLIQHVEILDDPGQIPNFQSIEQVLKQISS